MIYKVDIDITKTRTWDKYLGWLEFALSRLKEGNTSFDSCDVYETKHGYHLYFKNRDGFYFNDHTNLIECLLGLI